MSYSERRAKSADSSAGRKRSTGRAGRLEHQRLVGEERTRSRWTIGSPGQDAEIVCDGRPGIDQLAESTVVVRARPSDLRAELIVKKPSTAASTRVTAT